MAAGAAAGCGCRLLVVSSSSRCRRLSSSLRSPSFARRRNGGDVSLRMRLLVVANAANSTQPSPPAAGAVVVPDNEFSLAKVQKERSFIICRHGTVCFALHENVDTVNPIVFVFTAGTKSIDCLVCQHCCGTSCFVLHQND